MSLRGVKKDSNDMEKRAARRKKSALTVQLLAGKVPDPIARFLADIVEARSSDARYIDFAFLGSGGSSGALADELKPGSSSGKPHIVINKRIDGTLQQSFDQMVVPHEEKYQKGVAYLAEHKKVSHVAAPLPEFVFDPNHSEAAGEVFNSPGQVKTFCVCGRAFSFQLKLESNPLVTVGSFITITHGFGLILFFLLSDAIDANYGLETFRDYLEQLPIEKVAKTIGFRVSPGNSVWCPFGYVPVIIGWDRKTKPIKRRRKSTATSRMQCTRSLTVSLCTQRPN
jgi:hypothetical protein